MNKTACHWLSLAGPIVSLIFGCPAQAQISKDGTLSTEVDRSGEVFEITGGSRAGNNLFHSFEEFSVPTNNTAFFKNASDIANIIGRVTGGSLSNIDGLIRANGSANLILLNPNGISFGPNARLDIGGSFLGSTANSVQFADGTEFIAADGPALITVSVPVGLQMGPNGGAIQVQGPGHNRFDSNGGSLVEAPLEPRIGLQVQPEQTLALVGGDISLEGGILQAEAGRIELGSVREGQVSLNPAATEGWTLGYEGASFKDVELSSGALLETSGPAGGSIHLQGARISLREGSTLLIQAAQDAGSLSINAAESVEVNSSFIGTTAWGSGRGGDITVSANSLTVTDGGSLMSSTLGTGKGGDVIANVSGTTLVEKFSRSDRQVQGSSIFALTSGPADGGDVRINTNQLIIADGAEVGTSDSLRMVDGVPEVATGNAGTVVVTARESVEVFDTNQEAADVPRGLYSRLYSGTFGQGSSGDVSVSTGRLSIEDGGLVGAGVLRPSARFGEPAPESGTGQGGDLAVAAELIEVRGTSATAFRPSALGTFTLGAGNAGDAAINTARLVIQAGGGVSSLTYAQGDAGELSVNASESISVSGADAQTGFISEINASAALLNQELRATLFLPELPTGDTGELDINTNRLTITDGGRIAVQHDGTGAAGTLFVNADSISLDTGGAIAAGTGNGISPGAPPSTPASEAVEDGRDRGVEISTRQLTIQGRARISTTTLSEQAGSNITINASESVEVIGSGFGEFRDLVESVTGGTASLSSIENSSILTGSDGSGLAGNLSIETQQLILREGALVTSAATGAGRAGDLSVKAPGGLETSGSGLLSVTIGSGDAGTVTIDTSQLTVQDGAVVSTATLGDGAGGNLRVNASESVELLRTPVEAIIPTGLFTNTLGSGDAGDLTINTQQLIVRGGARATAQSGGFSVEGVAPLLGAGGNLIVTAPDSVEIEGTSPNPQFSTSTLSTATSSSAPAGSLEINTGQLAVQDEAEVAINSTGSGDAGNLLVEANSVLIDNQAGINATTQSGRGGNIAIAAENIVWRRNSNTTAAALGTGSGGNIFIEADTLVALEDSDITANALEGMGGNIEITAQGLFFCSTCQVSATSELGVDGEVELVNPEMEASLEFLEVPEEVIRPEQVVALSCAVNGGSSSQFTITGRGGLPPSPSDPLTSQALVTFAPSRQAEGASSSAVESSGRELPPPAQGWYVNAQGSVILAAKTPTATPRRAELIAPDCHTP